MPPRTRPFVRNPRYRTLEVYDRANGEIQNVERDEVEAFRLLQEGDGQRQKVRKGNGRDDGE